jgi:signal transduction histidine kinase
VVDRVDRNGRRLLLLVEDLLTLSQIESSALQIEPVVTDSRSVVTNAHASLASVLSNRQLDVVVSTPDEPVVHHGDPVQLERMVTNLLTNAVKFTPDGGTVEVVLRSDGELSEIVVKDDGMGITLDDQSKLFTRFFRSNEATEQAIQGTGLGLTIVKAIVAPARWPDQRVLGVRAGHHGVRHGPASRSRRAAVGRADGQDRDGVRVLATRPGRRAGRRRPRGPARCSPCR